MKKIIFWAATIVLTIEAYGMQNDLNKGSSSSCKRRFSETLDDQRKYSDVKGKRRCYSSEPEADLLDAYCETPTARNQVVSITELKNILTMDLTILDLHKLTVKVRENEVLDWNIIYQAASISPFLKELDVSDTKSGFMFINEEDGGLLVRCYNLVCGGAKQLLYSGEKRNYGIVDLLQDNSVNRNFSFGLFYLGNNILKLDIDIIKNGTFPDIESIVLTDNDLMAADNLNLSGVKKLKVSLSNKSLEGDLKFDDLMDKVNTTLETLDLSNNNLKRLPDSVKKYKKLKGLDLSGNRELSGLPKWLKDIKIEKLYMMNSMLNRESLPDVIWEVQSLRDFRVGGEDTNSLLNISSRISNLINLEYLSFAGRKIPYLPEEIGTLRKLQVLDLANCGLREIPENIFNLIYLRGLSLEGNDLGTISSSIINLKSLDSLVLSGIAHIEHIVPELENFTNLCMLDLSNCGLTSLPLNFEKLEYLQELILRNNQLTTIPQEIGNLKYLRTLDLRNNALERLPFSIQNIIQNGGNLFVDDLANISQFAENQRSLLAENIYARDLNFLSSKDKENALLLKQGGLFPDVEELEIDTAFLNEISIENLEFPNLKNLGINVLDEDFEFDEEFIDGKTVGICEYTDKLDSLIAKVTPTLQTLSVRNVRLKKIPETILNCSNLKSLELINCQIEDIPFSISNLSELTKVDFSNNELKTLPESFFNLTGLKDLVLTSNQFEVISPAIANLKGLEVLDLRYNLLNRFPDVICTLRNLIHLSVSENFIREIPSNINNLKNLRTLNVQSSFLEKLPYLEGDIIVFDLNRNLSVSRFLPDNDLKKYDYEKIDLSNKELTQIPLDISSYSCKELDISGNRLNKIPALLQRIHGLQKLNLRGNSIFSIEELPDELFGIGSLESIIMNSKQCPELLDDQSVSLIDMENNCYILEYKKAAIEYVRLDRIQRLKNKKAQIQKIKNDFKAYCDQLCFDMNNVDENVLKQIDLIKKNQLDDMEYDERLIDNKIKILNRSIYRIY